MPIPVAVRRLYKLGAVPEDYRAGWLRTQLSYIARALWTPVSRTVVGAVTVDGADCIILADATAAPFTVAFPPAVQMQFAYITVKKIDASANAVTLGATIDGAANPTLATQYKSKLVFSDGISWYTLATV